MLYWRCPSLARCSSSRGRPAAIIGRSALKRHDRFDLFGRERSWWCSAGEGRLGRPTPTEGASQHRPTGNTLRADSFSSPVSSGLADYSPPQVLPMFAGYSQTSTQRNPSRVVWQQSDILGQLVATAMGSAVGYRRPPIFLAALSLDYSVARQRPTMPATATFGSASASVSTRQRRGIPFSRSGGVRVVRLFP